MHKKSLSLFREMLRTSRSASGDNVRRLTMLRQKIREGFEEANSITSCDEQVNQLERGYRTLKFLRLASDESSTEHRIVGSLCIMGFYQSSYKIRPAIYGKKPSPEQKKAYEENSFFYDQTLKLLNETTGLCLR
ncbi:hypothetical protein DSO57_1013124 [Entomophthora muscae]|uniref:Uncharacterized protein n=1 Tax=Entomophthora muscae TaxID=34485 RepID=A0ACC2SUV0_9FUNG|nr:hypothetical protein DSO57_1013124 [Entomophthora muscae]